MKTAHIFVTGTVQGIGYRQFVKSVAKKHNVTGWVRNCADGSVEAILQGLEKDIIEVINVCKKGPFLAEVKDVVITWEEIKETFSDFVIYPTT